MAKSSEYSRSVLGGSDEDYSRSVLGASDEYVSGLAVVGSDAVEETLCEPCQKDGKPTDASLYCIDCSEYMCGECSKFHKKFKSFQYHVIKDVNRAHCEPCQKGGKTIHAEKNCTDCKENLCGQCSDFHVKFKAFEHHIIIAIETFNPNTKENTTTDTTESSKKMVAKSTEKIAKLHIDRENVQQTPAHPKSSSKAFKKVTAELLSTIDLTTSMDVRKATIFDLTLQKHYCVALDGGNKSIKVVDARNMCVTSEIHLREADCVWAITSVNEDQIAIMTVVKSVNTILFLSLSSSGIISANDHSVRVSNIYWGLVHSKDRFYASRYSSIDVIRMQGKTIRSVTKESFCGLGGIALSNDHNNIYVCSVTNHTVMSLDLNGKVKATYKDKDLKRPNGVTVDGEGYVYVCSVDTKSVYQLAADLSVGHVIVSGVDVLRCTFYKTGNQLILVNSSELKVYAVK